MLATAAQMSPSPPRPATVSVCFPFVGDVLGGSHVSALLLIQALRVHAQFRPEVVVHAEGAVTDELRRRGIEYTLLPLSISSTIAPSPLGRVARLLSLAPRLARFLRTRRCRVVHTNDMRMHLAWSVPAHLGGAKFVWHQRSKYVPSRLTLGALQLANRVACISTFGASTMPPTVRSRLRVIKNPVDSTAGVDRANARQALLQQLRLDGNCALVAFVGNLTEQKRPHVFLEVAARIAASVGRPAAFVLLGADHENRQDSLRRHAEQLGIERSVHFLGFRHPTEPWVGGCDLLIAPGFADAFGRTVVEAMVVGTPVIASASGGHLEIIEPDVTGMLVPVDDVEAFAGAAAALLSQPERGREMADRAQREVVPRYSVAQHITSVTNLYGELLG